MPARGVSGVTLNQFFTAVLQGLGVPVTQNNLNKLGAVARLEGHGGDYNPFNYVLGPGTNFNSVGVKNYPDVQTGIAQTIKLLSQRNTSGMRASLASDGPYSGWLDATSRFYNSWGGPNVRTTENNARTKLDEQVDGPAVPASQRANLGSTSASSTSSTSEQPADWAAIRKWQDQQEADFNKWLATQSAEAQKEIVDGLKSNLSLPEIAALQEKYGTGLSNYFGYLSKLPDEARQGALTKIDPGAAPTDPAASQELTNLLQTFGVSYPNAPQPTPALLAYLRGIGLSMSTAEDVKRRAIERIGAATSDAMVDIDRTAGRTKQNITADLVRRGILSSGESNTRYARQAEDVAAQKSDVVRTSTDAAESAENAYRTAADAARQQALDRVINAETEQTNATAAAKANEEAYARQTAAANTAYEQQRAAQDAALKAQTDAIARYANQGVTV